MAKLRHKAGWRLSDEARRKRKCQWTLSVKDDRPEMAGSECVTRPHAIDLDTHNEFLAQ